MRIKEYPVGTIFGEEEITAIQRVLNSGDILTRGSDVDLFEQEFAKYCGAKNAVAVSSCHDAWYCLVMCRDVMCHTNVPLS